MCMSMQYPEYAHKKDIAQVNVSTLTLTKEMSQMHNIHVLLMGNRSSSFHLSIYKQINANRLRQTFVTFWVDQSLC